MLPITAMATLFGSGYTVCMCNSVAQDVRLKLYELLIIQTFVLVSDLVICHSTQL